MQQNMLLVNKLIKHLKKNKFTFKKCTASGVWYVKRTWFFTNKAGVTVTITKEKENATKYRTHS